MSDLCDRLRGKYSVPVNDGGGPLDGKTTFERKFETPPIQHEAADKIKQLERKIYWLENQLECYQEQEG